MAQAHARNVRARSQTGSNKSAPARALRRAAAYDSCAHATRVPPLRANWCCVVENGMQNYSRTKRKSAGRTFYCTPARRLPPPSTSSSARARACGSLSVRVIPRAPRTRHHKPTSA
ncbi:hypothetical protein EON67_11985 [archaeon]|nr:MAG: hypothetical protein EON67_11985 [archaeon]